MNETPRELEEQEAVVGERRTQDWEFANFILELNERKRLTSDDVVNALKIYNETERAEHERIKEELANIQIELKRQIILAYFNQRLALHENAKMVYSFFQGWREGCIKLLTGETREEVEENLQIAEKNLDMKSVLEKLERSIADGEKLI